MVWVGYGWSAVASAAETPLLMFNVVDFDEMGKVVLRAEQ
jgi:hypothetical protein